MSAQAAWYVCEQAEKVTTRPPPSPSKSISNVVYERRGATRLPIEIDVDVEGAAHRFRSTTVDLSTGGLFVVTNHDIPVGTNVLLAFKLPNGTSLEVIGVVCWRRDRHLGSEAPGLGISFFCLEPEVKRTLETFCEVREALYANFDDDDGDFPQEPGDESGEFPVVGPVED